LLLERSTGIVNPEIPLGITSASEALSKKRKVFDTPSAPIKPFGDEIQQPELEVDEALLLSQMSIDTPLETTVCCHKACVYFLFSFRFVHHFVVSYDLIFSFFFL
jgi:hypothetical protein